MRLIANYVLFGLLVVISVAFGLPTADDVVPETLTETSEAAKHHRAIMLAKTQAAVHSMSHVAAQYKDCSEESHDRCAENGHVKEIISAQAYATKSSPAPARPPFRAGPIFT